MSTVLAVTAADIDGERLAELERVIATDQRRLYHIALAITRDAAEAEDAVQEVFLIAWRKWESITDQQKRRAWLTTICVRHCVRRRRISLSRWRTSEPWMEGAASDSSELHDQMLDLDRAQAKLSRQQRAVLRLCYRDGYSADQCADLMGLSPGTVRSHLARALATLRKEMSDD